MVPQLRLLITEVVTVWLLKAGGRIPGYVRLTKQVMRLSWFSRCWSSSQRLGRDFHGFSMSWKRLHGVAIDTALAGRHFPWDVTCQAASFHLRAPCSRIHPLLYRTLVQFIFLHPLPNSTIISSFWVFLPIPGKLNFPHLLNLVSKNILGYWGWFLFCFCFWTYV